ncbi:MAG: shikimate dehydrogenase [Microbacteriaceae bacterium]|nr:shikimate dehydrogenase [Microbacteriaceae bacterium]
MSGGRMGFVGVDTAGSSIMRVFPLWADELGLPSRDLRGFDVPVDAPAQAYRDVVTAIRDDPAQAGALVTTHKMRVFDAANDLFDGFDSFALACREVSSISKEDGRLSGMPRTRSPLGSRSSRLFPPTTSPRRMPRLSASARAAAAPPSRGTSRIAPTRRAPWLSRAGGRRPSITRARFTSAVESTRAFSTTGS